MHVLNNLGRGLWAVPEAPEKKKDEKKELPTGQAAAAKAVEEKVSKLGYEVKIRIVYIGPDAVLGKQRLQAIVGGFKQFNTTNLNGFTSGGITEGPQAIED